MPASISTKITEYLQVANWANSNSFLYEFTMSYLEYLVLGVRFAHVRQYAPLQHVSVSGILRDTVAEYTLVQTYVNPVNDATVEAAYVFPLYEGVAVSGFEAEVDGRQIVGKVQEKAAARKEYEDAVKVGKVASLLEQEKPDVFQASIGNIPPGKTIRIRITLVSEIKQDADENQVRFVLPTTIAPRYGSAPQIAGSFSTSKLSVEIACAMSKQITSIQSPSHTIQVHLGSSPMKVSLTADSLLDRDLVLIVQAVGLDSPRALVEHHPEDGTHAVSLTFAPRFSLNSLKSCELIFLVDRSGSMHSGSQIHQAGQALELFLRSIPSEDHYINVIGFGSHHQSLFPKSVEYDAESLRTTTKYAQALRADMGGTELLGAFQEVFERRRRDIPTQIFLLTDGQVWNVEALIQCVKEAVEEGEKRNSVVRVFSLGVGEAVSHHLIESVARAGGGYSQLVVEGERMEKKVVNMLKAALTPPVTNVSIQWRTPVEAGMEDFSGEDDFEMVEAAEEAADSQPVSVDPKPTISLFSLEAEIPSPPTPPPTTLPEVVIQTLQAPFKVPSLYRGARFTIYAILSSETPVPKEIILRGTSPDGPVELKVKVDSVQEGETILHSLAARTLVRDLEEGASCIHALGGTTTTTTTATNVQMLKNLGVHVVKDGKKCKNKLSDHVISKLTKQRILDLALKYKISSKYTSWVAIDTESERTIIHNNIITTQPQLLFGNVESSDLFGAGNSQSPATYDSGFNFRGPALASRATPSPFSAVPRSYFSAPGATFTPFGAVHSQQQMQPQGMNMTPAFGTTPTPGASFSSYGAVQPQQQMQAQWTNMTPNFGATPPSGAPFTPFGEAVQMQPQCAPAFGAPSDFGTASLFGFQSRPAIASGGDLFGATPPQKHLTGTLCSAKASPFGASTPRATNSFTADDGEERAEDRAAKDTNDPHRQLLSLVQHQQFDGLFPLVPEIAALLSTTVEGVKAKLGEFRNTNSGLQLADLEWETVWATCLAVQFLKQQLPELMEEWELVVEKAEKRVAAMAKNDEGVVAMQLAASEMVKKDE